MKVHLAYLAFLFIAIFTTVVTPQKTVSPQKKERITNDAVLTSREIAAKVLPSVVLITTFDAKGLPISQGSGFVYKSGIIVSNLHVFERATSASVKNVKTGEIAMAVAVLGMSAKQDICVFRIDKNNFPSVPIGDSWAIGTGDEIYVASNPRGLEGSFTKGVISGVRDRGRPGTNVIDTTLFQIDAAISPGSSGGLLVNTRGQAIGVIKSSVVGGQNLNFAIPIDQVVSLSLKFNEPIQLAGACAFTDRQKAHLKGPVQKVVVLRPKTGSNGRILNLNLPYLPMSETRYDRDGNKVESIGYVFNEARVSYKTISEYDDNRLRTSTTRVDGKTGKIEKIELDLEGRIQAKLQLQKIYLDTENANIARSKGLIAYDSDQNMVSEIVMSNGVFDLRYRYEYVFDAHGNWIKQVWFGNSSETEGRGTWVELPHILRQITYFD